MLYVKYILVVLLYTHHLYYHELLVRVVYSVPLNHLSAETFSVRLLDIDIFLDIFLLQDHVLQAHSTQLFGELKFLLILQKFLHMHE